MTIAVSSFLLIRSYRTTVQLPQSPDATASSSANIKQASPSAILIMSIGDVLVKQGNEWNTGYDGQALLEGNTVKTGTRGLASIEFVDIGVLRMEQNTEISLSNLTPVTVRVYQTIGDTYSKVKKLFDPGSAYEVETPTAVASVRGTAFGVLVNILKESRVIVTDNAVAVAPVRELDGIRTRLSQVTVEKGQATIINQEVIARAEQSQLPPSVSPQEIVLPREKLPWIEKNRSRDAEFDQKDQQKLLQNIQGASSGSAQREKREEQSIPISTTSLSPTPANNPIQQIIQPIREAIERLISPPPKPPESEKPTLTPSPSFSDESRNKTRDEQKEKEKEKENEMEKERKREKEKTKPITTPESSTAPPRVPSL